MKRQGFVRGAVCVLLWGWGVLAGSACARDRGRAVTVEESEGVVHLANDLVGLDFDLRTGKYSVRDLRRGVCVLADAEAKAQNSLPSRWAAAPTKYSWKEVAVRDETGDGQTLLLECEPASMYRPILLLRFTLHEGRPGLSISWGIRNHRAYAMRFTDVYVMVNGLMYPDMKIKDFQVLPSGAGRMNNLVRRIRAPWDDKTQYLNGAMLTFKKGGQRHTVVAGGLGYSDYLKTVIVADQSQFRRDLRKPTGRPSLALRVWDPVGKRVAPGAEYISPDTFYLDVATSDPFLGLEQYGLAMRRANGASPNVYDFPTLCGWMASGGGGGEGKPCNSSAGLVGQLDDARKSGLHRYTPLAVRLEPDAYCYGRHGNTQQGWWDDEHWAWRGRSLRPPYETFAKFGAGVKERGGILFTYYQYSMPSNDFALAHPEWMIHDDISRLHEEHAHHHPVVRYDYTDPGFQEYLLAMWRRMRAAGLAGVKFDYPETGWEWEGGFEDESHTTTSAYRAGFALCREGLGEDAFIHERMMGEGGVPTSDATVGIVDLQRVWRDAGHYQPEMGACMGLRWFKNRVCMTYYPDGKAFVRRGGIEVPRVQRRAFLTIIGYLSGRLELGSSCTTMTPEMIRELTRVFPMMRGPASPRPVDMLMGRKLPRVYVYDVLDGWKQVILANSDRKRATVVSAPFSGNQADTGSLGLDAEKEYYVFDFWNQRFLGKHEGTGKLSVKLKKDEVLVFSVREVLDRPQVLSTNRHITQGMMELSDVVWNAGAKALTGTAEVVGGEPFILTVACNGLRALKCSAGEGASRLIPREDGKGLTDLELSCAGNESVRFSIRFR